ncbi:hypothetical protein ET495_17325 (plasmid) [Xylanimonas allomyrinae]|uniref:Uncharacterized protein n=1 Tax=Xylanimonas allomyrinae TaxID=2509459 RepID=A0A4P6EQ86_9MICO|nr:hypothetical protein [Xylanimonas allomyrinae]QAY64982.1 hypothetical protein ET495_17325 [Xylanimonas allomyrinae]
MSTITADRREAICRAGRAVVCLSVDHDATEPAHRQAAIVNDVRAYDAREAWDAVAALEHMVFTRGLAPATD